MTKAIIAIGVCLFCIWLVLVFVQLAVWTVAKRVSLLEKRVHELVKELERKP